VAVFETGTLQFFNNGRGCLEQDALAALVAQTTAGGMLLSTAIGLLIFCGAVGKSGQVPLHVWLPDAMEGPTPVSALIHAATMVAAGVFLVARGFIHSCQRRRLDSPPKRPLCRSSRGPETITAVFAASIAIAQTDIKRILAYSTVHSLAS